MTARTKVTTLSPYEIALIETAVRNYLPQVNAHCGKALLEIIEKAKEIKVKF